MPSSRHDDYLKQLPTDWEQVRIAELGEVFSGGTPSREEPSFWNGSIAWVTPGELAKLDSKLLTDTNECITKSGLSGSAARLLPQGSILVTTRATIGAVAVAAVPVSTNQGFKSIVPNGSADSNFYYHLLRRVAHEMTRLAAGSTFAEISRRDFASIVLPRPSLKEQRRIAEILDTADEAIQKTEALISKLKQVKAGLTYDLLTRGIDEDGQLRDPEAHPGHFEISSLGQIPKAWGVPKLVHLTSVKNGTTPSRGEPRYWNNGTVPWLPTGKVHDRIIRKADQRITETALRHCSLDLLDAGTILIAMIGQGLTRGKAAYLAVPACINQNFAAILPCPDFDSKFLFHYLEHNYIRVRNAGRGSNQEALNCSVVSNLKVVLPPLDEQRAISAMLDAQDERIREEEAYRGKLKLLKEGLMEDLLTGRVRMSV